MKLDHQLIPYTKINSRWIKDLSVSCKTIKILEENIGRKISDISHRNIWLIYLLRQGKQRKKINKWDCIKLKSFRTAKEIIKKMNREPTVWENIFANDTSDKGLISKIYCIRTYTTQHQENPIKNRAGD